MTTSAAQKDQTDQNRVDDLVAENKRLGPSISKALKAEAESLKEAGGYNEGQKLGVEMRMKKKILSENTQRFKEEIGNFYNEMDEYKWGKPLKILFDKSLDMQFFCRRGALNTQKGFSVTCVQ